MKRFTLLKTMLLLCALIVGSGSAWGDTVTFNYADYKGEGTTSSGSSYTMVKTDVSIGDTKFYGNNSQAHFYASGTSTITPASGVTITQIVLTATEESYNGYQSKGTVTASAGSLAHSGVTLTWTGSATSAFTINHSKQIRWTSIVVTYTKSVSYTITAVSNNNSWGTVSGTTTITAVPNDGFRVKSGDDGYTVTSGTATVVNNGDNTFVVSPSSNCTVQINFEAIPTHSITWNVNGATTIESYGEDASIDFPSNPASIGGKVFIGWSKAEIDGTTETKPTLYTEGVMGISDITYYAVFATATGGGEDTYEKITSSTLDTGATYIFGAEQSSTDHTMWYLNSYAEVDKNSTWGVSSTSPGSAIKFTLSGTASSLKAIDESGNYLVPWKTNFRMESEDSNKALFSISASGVMTGKSGGDGTTVVNFRYNYNNGNGGFRWYDGSTGTQAYLYKVIPGTTYSAYCTSITEPITISAAKYATFCSPYKLDYSGTGVKVYTAKSTGSSVKLTEVEDGIVPANAGVVLYSETANTYNIPVTSAAGSDYDAENNELVGINVRTSVAADGGDGKTNYILSNEDAGVGFYKATTSGAYLAAHRAYLSTTGVAASRSFLGFDDETTGIETINTNPETVSGVQEYYNLNGQRVTTPTKGLYIVNGKKVIINK